MNPPTNVRKSQITKRYLRKDGSIVTKQYEQTYIVKDRTAQNLRKAITPKLKTATVEQLQQINRILGGIDEDGNGNDRHADAPAGGGEGGAPGVAATAEEGNKEGGNKKASDR